MVCLYRVQFERVQRIAAGLTCPAVRVAVRVPHPSSAPSHMALQEISNVMNGARGLVKLVQAAADSTSYTSTEDILPVLDIAPFLDSADGEASKGLAVQIAHSLKTTGCLVIRDPRIDPSENEVFMDMMEEYFSRSQDQKMQDVRAALHYQVGATPAGVEVPRCLQDPGCQEKLQQLPPQHRASPPSGPDVKWRFLWRVGPRPASTEFAELNAEPVIPEGMPQWQQVMDSWGNNMVNAVAAVAQLAAQGLGLEQQAFLQRMQLGPHLLAPTGSDLAAHGQLGTVLAGWHYDLNFLTIHGRSRFPGLAVWLADGRRATVRIPPGCLLVQAGKQMEWLTGGVVQAGMHEVVVTPETQSAIAAASAGKRCLWRISSTLFAHIASDQVLEPLGAFATPEALAAYPPTKTGTQVQEELAMINLKGSA